MIDLTGVTHHPAVEEMTNVLCNKTQRQDKGFYRPVIAYFLGKVAANMRVSILTEDRGVLPVNIYTVAFASSGFGKNYSVNIIEKEFLNQFKARFLEETFPAIAQTSLDKIALNRSAKNNSIYEEELEKTEKEFKSKGTILYTFDSGTVPALKQMREKLLMANVGSINYQIDEIGSKIQESTEMMVSFLELYDLGIIKPKLIKNTQDNVRSEDIDGTTPTNMLAFGTPSKLFDGGKVEELFFEMLSTGYARRCLFGLAFYSDKSYVFPTPEELYANLTDKSNIKSVEVLSTHFGTLADPSLYGWKLNVSKDVSIKLLEYKINCEKFASGLPDHAEILKAEISHRYFKALKLAGAYAFYDLSTEITMNHLLQAILLVEESGEVFKHILKREKTYVKLAKYIATHDGELTHADLHANLPYYKTSTSARNELISLARAWGYKNNVVIKLRYVDNIELISGETLEHTDLDKLILSYSNHFADNYIPQLAPFNQLHKLTQQDNLHWCNHYFVDNHRKEANVIQGFNTIVVDIDGEASLSQVHELLKDYTFMTYTTKRHTEEENRFRLIIPMNYHLNLDKEEYAEFMASFLAWFPFKTDEGANQRSRKWQTHNGSYHYNYGELLDVIQFIPNTSKNDEFKKNNSIGSMDNFERWFARRITDGNRNNEILKYALSLVDAGMDLQSVTKQVLSFNKKISAPLDEEELSKTVFVTVAKKIAENKE